MTLDKIGANQTVLNFNDGTTVLFSYSTPVAAFVPGRGYVKTSAHYSRTTTKHVNQWTGGKVAEEPQAFFDALAKRA